MAMSGVEGQVFNSSNMGYVAPISSPKNPLGISAAGVFNNLSIPLMVGGGLLLFYFTMKARKKR